MDSEGILDLTGLIPETDIDGVAQNVTTIVEVRTE